MLTSKTTKLQALGLLGAWLESVAFHPASRELRLVLAVPGEDDLTVLAFNETSRCDARSRGQSPAVPVIARVRAPRRGHFEIKLLSGDTWAIQAVSWSYFSPLRHAA